MVGGGQGVSMEGDLNFQKDSDPGKEPWRQRIKAR